MRLVLVHGINQQGKSSEVLSKQWLDALRAGAGMDANWPQDVTSNITVPFYGDRLFALAETKTDWSSVTQGADEADDEFTEFAYDAFVRMAMQAGITQEELRLEVGDGQVPMGGRAVQEMAESVSPFDGAAHAVACKLWAYAIETSPRLLEASAHQIRG